MNLTSGVIGFDHVPSIPIVSSKDGFFPGVEGRIYHLLTGEGPTLPVCKPDEEEGDTQAVIKQ